MEPDFYIELTLLDKSILMILMYEISILCKKEGLPFTIRGYQTY